MTTSGFEIGCSVDVTVVNERVIKTSKGGFENNSHAEAAAAGLLAYAHDLDAQPLRTPTVYEVEVVEKESGFHVRHACELIEGPSLSRLSKTGGEPHHIAVARALAQVAEMDTLSDGEALRVPFDGKASNFHVDTQGPAMIDLFPAMSRLPDGSFPLLPWMRQNRFANFFAWTLSTKTGVMTRILASSINRGDTVASAIKHTITQRDAWCYDALPPGLDPRIRDRLRREVAARFIPFALRGVSHRTLEKASL